MNTADLSPIAVTPIQTLPAAAPAAPSGDGSLTFNDLLDIVNPLQHIPIVGTLYRAITGDTIKTFPKIAGDTLYGGMEGFASSIADTVFEKITGHNFGDTVLAMVENLFDSSPAGAPATAVASNAAVDTSAPAGMSDTPGLTGPNLTAPAAVSNASLETFVIPGQDALFNALRRGTGQEAALRATSAYHRTLSVTHLAVNAALQAPALRATLQ